MQFKGILDSLATSLLEVYIEPYKELGSLDDLDVNLGDINLDKLNEPTRSIISINAKKTLEPIKDFNAVIALHGHLERLIPLIVIMYNQLRCN